MRRAAAVLLLIAPVPAAGCGQDERQDTATAGWQVCRNEQYGYEIRYPRGYDLWPTGPVDRRDGASIRIALKDHAAPTPVLDLFVGEVAGEHGLPEDETLPDMERMVEETEIDGLPARMVAWRWTENRQIVFVDVSTPGMLFQFHANPGLTSLRDTVWWQIISTFRFIEETSP